MQMITSLINVTVTKVIFVREKKWVFQMDLNGFMPRLIVKISVCCNTVSHYEIYKVRVNLYNPEKSVFKNSAVTSGYCGKGGKRRKVIFIH